MVAGLELRDGFFDGGLAIAGDDHPVLRAMAVELQRQPVPRLHLDALGDEAGRGVYDAPGTPRAVLVISDIIANGGCGLGQGVHNPLPFGVDACRRSEEHTSELQSLMRLSYAVFCLKK